MHTAAMLVETPILVKADSIIITNLNREIPYNYCHVNRVEDEGGGGHERLWLSL